MKEHAITHLEHKNVPALQKSLLFPKARASFISRIGGKSLKFNAMTSLSADIPLAMRTDDPTTMARTNSTKLRTARVDSNNYYFTLKLLLELAFS